MILNPYLDFAIATRERFGRSMVRETARIRVDAVRSGDVDSTILVYSIHNTNVLLPIPNMPFVTGLIRIVLNNAKRTNPQVPKLKRLSDKNGILKSLGHC